MRIGIIDISTFSYPIDNGIFDTWSLKVRNEFYNHVIEEWYFRLRVANELSNLPSAEE